jgi:hypothetical protein
MRGGSTRPYDFLSGVASSEVVFDDTKMEHVVKLIVQTTQLLSDRFYHSPINRIPRYDRATRLLIHVTNERG